MESWISIAFYLHLNVLSFSLRLSPRPVSSQLFYIVFIQLQALVYNPPITVNLAIRFSLWYGQTFRIIIFNCYDDILYWSLTNLSCTGTLWNPVCSICAEYIGFSVKQKLVLLSYKNTSHYHSWRSTHNLLVEQILKDHIYATNTLATGLNLDKL